MLHAVLEVLVKFRSTIALVGIYCLLFTLNACRPSDPPSSQTLTAPPLATPTPKRTPELAILRGNYTFAASGTNRHGNFSIAGVVILDNADGACTVKGGEQ